MNRPPVKSETQQWIDAYKNGDRPYAHLAIDDTFELVAVIQAQDQLTISPIVLRRGFALWRGLNFACRVRKATLAVTIEPGGRIVWDKPMKANASGVIRVRVSVPPWADDLLHAKESDSSHAFSIAFDGTVKLRNVCKPRPFEVEFTAKGAATVAISKMDYLASALEALKRVPVIGDLLAGPILRLYDAEKSAESEARVRADIHDLNGVSANILTEILHLKDTTDQSTANLISDAVALQINRAAKIAPELSQWPLLFSQDFVFQEFNALFGSDPAPLRVAINSYGFSLKGHEPDEIIHNFLAQLVGSDATKLRSAFIALKKAKPTSKMLEAIVASLSSSS